MKKKYTKPFITIYYLGDEILEIVRISNMEGEIEDPQEAEPLEDESGNNSY